MPDEERPAAASLPDSPTSGARAPHAEAGESRTELLKRIRVKEQELEGLLEEARREAAKLLEEARREADAMLAGTAALTESDMDDEVAGDREAAEAEAGRITAAFTLEAERVRREAGERVDAAARRVLQAILPDGRGASGGRP